MQSLFHEQEGLSHVSLRDRTGCTGLYVNYSIIFTEISFYPETSILLQMIRIIHMHIGLYQNLTDKGGRLSVLAPGQPELDLQEIKN